MLSPLLSLLALAAPFDLSTSAEAPSEDATTAAVEDESSTLFTGATFYLGDAEGTRVSAILVEGGRVVEFGEEHEFADRRVAGEFDVVDLGGGFVVPGLQDAHGDVLQLGRRLEELDVSNCADDEALFARLEEFAKGLEAGEWLLAYGWEPDELPAMGSELTEQLSVRFPTRPVRLLHAAEEIALVNRRALGACSISADEPSSVTRGMIQRDEEGNPTGLLYGRALDILEDELKKPTREDYFRRILMAQDELLRLGVTAVHDMGVTPESEAVYLQLIEADKLKVRIVGYLDGRRGLTEEQLERGPVAWGERDLFCIRGVAFQADGDLATRTASLLTSYKHQLPMRSNWHPTDSELRAGIASAVAVRLQPAVRATGDQASRTVLDIFQEIAIADPNSRLLRPRLESALVVSPKDWARFPELGVLPSMQPVEARTGWIEKRLPADQVRGTLAWRDVAPDVGRIAFGSDFPRRTADPRLGLHAARELANQAGTDPSESAGISELVNARAALLGYTLGAAHAAHQDDRRGRLFQGYWADMTVFDRDPVEGTTDELLEANVTATIINGEVVWRRNV